MIRNYFKIALRALTRHKTHSLINILGLVVGIAFSCMLYIYVHNELSYDTFHTKSDRLFRIISVDKRVPGNIRHYGITVPPVGKELADHYPEVTDMVRLHRFTGQVVFEMDGQPFQERNWYTTTDPDFFTVFDFPFVSGDKATALREPFSVVITETTAKKYFGDKDPVGQVIEKCNFGAVTVTGVIKDFPDNSHLQFDMLFSRVLPEDDWAAYMNDWDEFGAYTYIVLTDRGAIESLKAKMPALQKKYLARYGGALALDFQCIEDIYLGSEHIEAGTESGQGRMAYVYIFTSMGIFLLLIACINYINLATARATARAREIGVRKVAGAYKKQLVFQFLTESLVVAFIAMILAIGVMDLVFPYFNEITGKTFDITPVTLPTYLRPLLVVTLVIGLFSGSYPAFYLARLQPVISLKGNDPGGSSRGTAGLRKTLVVCQFVLTIVMIASTLVVGRQLSFIRDKDIGFDKDRLLVIDINSGQVRQQFQAMKNGFAAIPGVQQVAVSSRVPGEWKNIREIYVRSNNAPDSIKTYFMGFDESMPDTYRLQLAEGTYFPANGETDSTQILLNESAVKALGLAHPVGSIVKLNTGQGEMNAAVIGVVRDFNFQSLHQKIAPVVIGTWNNPFQYIDYFTLKVSGDMEEVIAGATQVHEKFDHHTPMEYHFLDQQLESFYVAERRAGMIFTMGGVLSIFIACLGLFGLASYNIRQRTKELGIRKVLGASGLNLFLLLSSSFAKQIGIAFLIACPMAYYIMNQWLSVFEYRISLHAGIFVLSGLTALAIALVTVSFQSLKAAQANPLNSLKHE